MFVAVVAFAFGVLVRDVAQDWRDLEAKERAVTAAAAAVHVPREPALRMPCARWVAQRGAGEPWQVKCF